MTDAPTTRETADHAELARLAEAALIPMPEKRRKSWFNRQNRFRDAMTPAVCSAILSEIAALRGDLTETRVAADLLVSSVRADLRQAERQRDELRNAADAMMPLLALIEDGLWEDCPYPDVQAKRIASLRTQLANQGADQ